MNNINTPKTIIITIILLFFYQNSLFAGNKNIQNIFNQLQAIKSEINSTSMPVNVVFKAKPQDFDESNHHFTGAQGFCTDGNYFYVALVSKSDNDYVNQETKFLKIDVKTLKVVYQKFVGKIGHSNSLAYNPNNSSICSAPCSKSMPYIFKFDSNFNKKEIKYLMKKPNEKYSGLKRIATLTYNSIQKCYIIKSGGQHLLFFDDNFNLMKEISCSEPILKANSVAQAISCDGKSMFTVCGNYNKPTQNYVRGFALSSGAITHNITYSQALAPNNEKIELEQIAFIQNNVYGLAFNHDDKSFIIYKLK